MNRPLGTFVTMVGIAMIGACDDTTGPRGTAEVRIAHVATATGALEVVLDGQTIDAALQPGSSISRTLELGRHSLALRGSSSLEIEPFFGEFSQVWGMMIVEAPELRVRVIGATRNDGNLVSLNTLNSVPGSEGWTIALLGDGTRSERTIPFLATASFLVEPGRYTVQAWQEDTPNERLDLGEIELTTDSNFLAVGPSVSDESAPGLLVVF